MWCAISATGVVFLSETPHSRQYVCIFVCHFLNTCPFTTQYLSFPASQCKNSRYPTPPPTKKNRENEPRVFWTRVCKQKQRFPATSFKQICLHLGPEFTVHAGFRGKGFFPHAFTLPSVKGPTINGVTYEGVVEFIYLGTLISNDNSVEKEMQRRILAGSRTYFAAISLFRS